MNVSDFDYRLPPEHIAQEPARPRDHSRLLVVNRAAGTLAHRRFYELGEFLRPGDLLVVNDSRVFKARLAGSVTSAAVEIFLLRPDDRGRWLALAKPGKKLLVDSTVTFSDDSVATVVDKREDGTVVLDFNKTPEEVMRWTDSVGQVPLPPYISNTDTTVREDYQTVYARETGSVAAPTAGLHFTPELIAKLKTQGVRFASVTLHVGLGTFRPMKTERIEDHVMHEEWVDVPDETTHVVEETRARGGRVIAVGTTSVRTLESGVRHGFTNIFITPGYKFKMVDAMITNFHLPKSTLLVLVSAFAGRELILRAYDEAIENDYRFYSFGDAMLIL